MSSDIKVAHKMGCVSSSSSSANNASNPSRSRGKGKRGKRGNKRKSAPSLHLSTQFSKAGQVDPRPVSQVADAGLLDGYDLLADLGR